MSLVKLSEARRFMIDCFKAVGAKLKPAEQHAEILVQADRMGHQSHGLNRLEKYLNDIIYKDCEPNNEPEILTESHSTAWVDAHNCLGSTASFFGTDLAIQKAKECGMGFVAVKGSNHHGMVGFWARLCANEGLIGLAFTNSSPLLAPTRSKKVALGTNPLAIVAPAADGEMLYLEMATTAVALGAIEMRLRAHQPIPLGWALGPDGHETTDAELAFKTSMLMPLGGGEMTSGYKGYGLSAAVDMLSGILAGSNYAHHVRKWGSARGTPANLGHSFMAIKPECYAPGFGERITECIRYWRTLPPADPKKPVMAPGDVEKQAMEKTDKQGGILYLPELIEASITLAEKLRVQPMQISE
ncbi:putative oxidoreductase YjmC [Anticarsia gemmatalis]|uniref:putative oxidoreductase YjmC n=1 Tax=Anticarsia gemmatalis TaxID=129554 RepID=UPI003F76938D